MSYTTVKSTSGHGGQNHMKIMLYPNETYGDEVACEDGGIVAEAVKSCFDTLASKDKIEGYTLYKWDDTLEVTGDYFHDLCNEFETKLTNNASYYPDKNGCHMLVAGRYNNSDACRTTDGLNDNSFNESRRAFIGRGTEMSAGYIENFSIMEPLHTMFDEDWLVNNTDLLYGSGDDADEHALGKIETSYDNVTPMLTGHVNSRDLYYEVGKAGKCQTDASWDEGFTKDITSCTIEAVRQTDKNS